MTIITVYVRSPISGCITGRNNYCNGNCSNPDSTCTGSGNTHGTCMSSTSPVDIGGTGTINLRVNFPNVLSVITYINLVCCSTTYANDYRRMVTVELYGKSNGKCFIGKVRYGHVANPSVANNTIYNLPTSGVLALGTVPSGSPGSCYTGAHSHMERSGSTGSTLAPCCGTTVSSSSNIYKFTWDNSPAVCPF